MRITELKTSDGKSIALNKFTVLVGPNNVGKSQTLKDIYAIMTKGREAKPTLLSSIEAQKPPTFDELVQDLRLRGHPDNVDLHEISGIGADLIKGDTLNLRLEDFKRQFDQELNLNFIYGNIGKFKVSYLDAESRLKIVKQSPGFNPNSHHPTNPLQALYVIPSIEQEVRKAFFDAFDMEVKLDYSGMTDFVMRVSKSFGSIPDDPRTAFPIMAGFHRLDDEGDGYKSFVGVVLSLLLSQNRIALLDEPEAFLHPAQSRALGAWISEFSKNSPSQIIIATHNSYFLAGILSTGQPVDIYRLNRKDNDTSYTHISSEATASLAKSPLLSSQRVLDAIFHRGVIVCEADADRAVYQMVASVEHKTQEYIFIHSHNKQTIPPVVKLLKEASIPTRAIADIDIVNDPSLLSVIETLGNSVHMSDLSKLQKDIIQEVEQEDEATALLYIQNKIAEFLSQLQKNEHKLAGARGALNRLRNDASKWDQVKRVGVNGPNKKLNDDLNQMIALAKQGGLYIAPVGELEKWMDLGVSKKNKWIIPALKAIYEGRCGHELRTFIGEIISDIKVNG